MHQMQLIVVPYTVYIQNDLNLLVYPFFARLILSLPLSFSLSTESTSP